MPGGYVDRGFDPASDDESDQLGFITPGRAQGLPLDYTNVDSPYYVGSQWSFADGGQPTLQDFTGSSRNPMMPMYRKGGNVVMTYNGVEYTEKDLRRMKRKDPRMFEELMFRANTEKQKAIMNEINNMRVDVEATSNTESFIGGADSWSEWYMDPAQEAYRNSRYQAYVDRRKKEGLSAPLDADTYHKNYVIYQNQVNELEKTMSQEDRNNPGWDRTHEYTPCPEGATDCIEIDGQMWQKGTQDKGMNWKYKEVFGADAMDEDMIHHMQSGYIGGVAMNLTGDELTEYEQSGVGDQTTFGMSITGEDGFFGNTMNDQREKTEITTTTDAVPCSNAAEMEKACTEAGGTWTPYVEAVVDADGNETTPASGCSCDKEISIPERETTPRETPFWLQDELGLANARDAKLSLRKRYPWAPFYNQPEIDTVFKDPTREIAAIGEQAAQAAEVAKAFGSGAGRGMAAALAAQGEANKAIANTMNQIQSDNVTVANQAAVKNAELEYKTQMLNNNEKKQLYDNTVLVEENYDNALRKANAAITQQLQNAYTNRANTANLNSIYPQFNITPDTGGIIEITDPKSFYADPNYTDPKSNAQQYIKEREEWKELTGSYDGFPEYERPDNSKAGQTTNAQELADVITQGGYQGNQRRGGERKMRILRKGAQLRNFFLPYGK